MSAITTITSGELNYHNLNFQSNDDALMRSMDFKNDSLEDSMSTNMDGKRMRKAVFRRTIDYNSSVALFIEQRTWKRKYSSRSAIQPDIMYQHLLTPPTDYRDNPMNCVCAKHVRTSTNKNKCPIYAVCWTPDGRRLITGASSGEFTLWNGLTFNFETILQAHDTHIRAMKWSNNEEWLVSADDSGFVKYWQANMNDVNVFQAHKDSVRGVSFCPSDKKFVTCSNDNTVRIWDFQTYKEERVLRGHGGEVRCVAWHPTKSLLLSGSKDSQQPLKLWDPKAGECISTMYVHKSTCTDIGINKNGNWFLTASKDHSIKLFDLRNLKTEMQVFRGHKKDVIRVAWHPYHETLFASGSGDGALLYWLVGTDMEVGAVEDAHDNIIWSLDWHPMGHILASGSNDFATKFWTRNRPGDVLKDNLQEEQTSASAAKKEPTSAHINGHSNTVSNPDIELENMIKQSESEKVFEFDIHKLSSTIAAEIDRSEKNEKSDIPGLSEGLHSGGTNHNHSSSTVGDDDFDFDKEESKLRSGGGGGGGAAVSRTIPKQFSANWANKKSTPAVYTNEANNPLFTTHGQPPILPVITPIIALPPPTPVAVRPSLFPMQAVPANNRLPSVHEIIPFGQQQQQQQQHQNQQQQQQQHFLQDEPPSQPVDDSAFRMMRPPLMHGPRNFRPNVAIARDSFQQQQQQQQPQFRPFIDLFGNIAGGGGGGGYDGPLGHQQQQHQQQQQQHHHHHNQGGFPMFSPCGGGGGGGDFPPQNRMHPMRNAPNFRMDFGGPQDERHHHHQNMQHRGGGGGGGGGGDFMRHGRPPPHHQQQHHNQQQHHHGGGNNRRGGRYGPSSGNQHQQQQQRQQQQQYHEDSENPFEPSKSTGSSKTFIPLPQKHDDQQQNKRNNKNRMNNNNRSSSNW